MTKNRNNQLLNGSIKLLIAGLMVWVLYRQVFAKDNIEQIGTTFLATLKSQPLTPLLLVIALMPVNWIFETLKWRLLIQDFEQLSFRKSLAAIFAGVAFSILTPNRIGEYGGRVLFVKPENNWKTVVATLVGSYSQLLAILSFGIVGFVFFVSEYLSLEPIILRSVLFLSIMLILIMLFCFYNIDLIIPLAKKIPYAYKLKRIVKNVSVLRNYNRSVLNKTLLFSSLRYLVYSLQYYLILKYFGIEIGLIAGCSGIATIYLFQTSIPLPPLMGLMARGELAIFIWSNFSANEISILAATFVLWIINIIIPALVGTVFIGNINILKSLGYGKKQR